MHGICYLKWKKALAGYWTSGLTLAEYCRRNQLSIKAAGRWKLKFEKEKPDLRKTENLDIVPVMTTNQIALPSFSGISLEFGDLKIKLDAGFDPNTLKQVLSVLETVK